jgi:hypothetical protein
MLDETTTTLRTIFFLTLFAIIYSSTIDIPNTRTNIQSTVVIPSVTIRYHRSRFLLPRHSSHRDLTPRCACASG